MINYILKIEGISKRFFANTVLDDINLKIKKGEVHAVVGENGAGKTTLMKIIGGIYTSSEGKIIFDGCEVNFSSPQEAINSGISIVHQELSLAPKLNVAQNIFSHREPVNKLGFIKWTELRYKTKQILKHIGIDIDPSTLVGDLSVGMQQIVEIAKALSQNAKIIIFDEPTSALSEKEVNLLYRVINDLKSKGVTIIFISHKLMEVFKISDKLSVLRDGKLIGTRKTKETSIEEIIKMMVGRELGNLYPDKSSHIGEKIFSVKGFSRKAKFEGIEFDLYKGEILGFAGLVGSGRTEVARSIFGAEKPESGEVILEGKKVEIKSPRDAIKNGICYLTEDRKSWGLFLEKTLRQNIIAASINKFLNKRGFLKNRKIKEKAKHFIDYLNIKPADDKILVLNLSGGNQQKTLLAQWLNTEPKILIVDEPTRGVDVGAKAEIHKHLRKLVESGVGVIIISSELPEIIGLCDRIAVFNEGKITGILEKDATQEEIMKYATL